MIFTDPGVTAAFSRRPQNMSLSYGRTAEALANRRDFLSGLGIDYRDLVRAKQTHSQRVHYATYLDKGRGALAYDTAVEETDALITDKRNLPLAVFTADCLSLFLYDPLRPAVGIVHAGWRSTSKGIVTQAVGRMQELFGTRPGNLLAGFGPLIKDCCYEVKEEFLGFFPGHVKERGKRLFLDLAGANRAQLLTCGLSGGNIFDHGSCTFCGGEDFFSFRREAEAAGRMISIIMLR